MSGKSIFKCLWHTSITEASLLRCPPLDLSNVSDKPLYRYLHIDNPNPQASHKHKLVQDFIEQNPNHPLVDSFSILVLGTADNSHQKMQAAIKSLVDHHLQHLSDDEQANSLAAILFNSDLFSDDAVQNVAGKHNGTASMH